jgi:hypothetical protein
MPEEELDLESPAEFQPMGGEPVEHRPGERAGAARVGLALLVELVDGRERPSRARREPDRLGRIRHQPCVARWSGDVGRGRDLVVDLEHREDRGQADPEPHGLLEPTEGDRLHEGDARVDHDRERDRLDAGGGEASRGVHGGGPAAGDLRPPAGRGHRTQNNSRYSARSQSDTES